jgi:hypothetical protein
MAARKKIRTAIDFIQQLTPVGDNGAIIAIDPHSGDISAQGYVGGSLDRIEAFIEKHSNKNLYWNPNALKRPDNKKAKKEDIKAMCWAHLDKDDATLEALDRIRRYRLPPTLIVFSGGGYNVYWRLSKPIHANGNIERTCSGGPRPFFPGDRRGGPLRHGSRRPVPPAGEGRRADRDPGGRG